MSSLSSGESSWAKGCGSDGGRVEGLDGEEMEGRGARTGEVGWRSRMERMREDGSTFGVIVVDEVVVTKTNL